jgi:hypothetical protein
MAAKTIRANLGDASPILKTTVRTLVLAVKVSLHLLLPLQKFTLASAMKATVVKIVIVVRFVPISIHLLMDTCM